VWVVPGGQLNITGVATAGLPSTETCSPLGLVAIVIGTLKLTVSVIGPFITMVGWFWGPLYEPLPVPVQLWNV